MNRSSPELPDELEVVGFLGCDGVGTTTHADRTADYFESRGFDVYQVWMRFEHFYSLPVLGAARALGLTELHEDDGHSIRAHHFEKSDWITSVYERTLLRDQRRFVQKQFAAVPDDADVLVADRFILDALVDLAVSTKDLSLLNGRLAAKFWELVPERATIIGLQCDAETIASRRPDVAPDPHLELRTEAYDCLFKHDNIDVVQTSQQFHDATREVQKYLGDSQ